MNVKFLTYNTFLRPYAIKTNEDDYKQERMEDMIEAFKDFDIVSLQEAFDSFSHRQHELCSRMASAGFKYLSSSTKPGFCELKLIDGGIIVFSKFPIVESRFFDFGTMGQSDGLSKKGVLYCRIQINCGSKQEYQTQNISKNNDNLLEKIRPIQPTFINLFATHAQASYFDLGEVKRTGSFFIQYDQMIILRKAVEEIYDQCKTRIEV